MTDRPRWHFTARAGWINDPYGVYWDGDRYHLFFQALPDRVGWSPECAWGHAVSADLVHWEEQAPVLVPAAFETGCWSGSVVPTSGGPLAFYTRVRAANLEIGQVAVARWCADGRFVASPEVVIDGPPDAAVAFRDPFVLRDGPDWLMLVGGADPAGEGRVLAYRSPDLGSWRYAGVFSSGRVDVGRPHTRQVWECAQLASLGGRWVLVVSVQIDGLAGPVMALVGERDGDRLRVACTERLIDGPAAYATTLFRDRDDRLCMLSWLRHDTVRAGRDWAGAHSAVSTLGLCGDRVVVAPHPAVPVHRATSDIAVCEDGDVLEVWTSGRYGAWWRD